MIYSKVVDSIQMKTPVEVDITLESVTVPNAGLSVKDIYTMYARGEVPRPRPAHDEGSELKEEYVPTDPMDALQKSLNYQRQQVMQAAQQETVQQTASETVPESPDTAQI